MLHIKGVELRAKGKVSLTENARDCNSKHIESSPRSLRDECWLKQTNQPGIPAVECQQHCYWKVSTQDTWVVPLEPLKENLAIHA